MSTLTTNLGLTKDASNEYYDISKVNANLDLIDAEVAKRVDKSSITAVNDFIVGTGSATVAKKTLAETKTILAINNVDNTSDASKPVSTAQQTALNLKANLASPAFTGTPTGITKTHVGLANVDNTSDASKPVSTAQQTALNLKANLASPAFTGTPTGITKTHVGLGNVDNTSDANKPVSTAQAAADALKIDKSIFTAQGDILYSSAANTPVKLAKGTALQQLRMNEGATAPEWATIASDDGGYKKIAETIVGADIASVSFTGISLAYKRLKVIFEAANNTTDDGMTIQFNSGGIYDYLTTYSYYNGVGGSVVTNQATLQVALPAYSVGRPGVAQGELDISRIVFTSGFDHPFKLHLAYRTPVLNAYPQPISSVRYNIYNGVWSGGDVTSITFSVPASGAIKAGSRFLLLGVM